MLAPEVAYQGVDTVVCDSNNTGRVAQERASSRDRVENGVETQLGWLTSRLP